MPTAWPAKTVLNLIFLAAQTDAAAIGDDDDFQKNTRQSFVGRVSKRIRSPTRNSNAKPSPLLAGNGPLESWTVP
jgi:hypothetical protein